MKPREIDWKIVACLYNAELVNGQDSALKAAFAFARYGRPPGSIAHRIAERVAAEFNITTCEILGASSDHYICQVRAVAMLVMKERGFRGKEIAATFSRTAPRVTQALKRLDDDMAKNMILAAHVKVLLERREKEAARG